jgi:hypothetical protein
MYACQASRRKSLNAISEMAIRLGLVVPFDQRYLQLGSVTKRLTSTKTNIRIAKEELHMTKKSIAEHRNDEKFEEGGSPSASPKQRSFGWAESQPQLWQRALWESSHAGIRDLARAQDSGDGALGPLITRRAGAAVRNNTQFNLNLDTVFTRAWRRPALRQGSAASPRA